MDGRGADRELDCLGLYCPMPVTMTRKEVEKLEQGEVLRVVADDPAAEEDITRWARRTGNELISLEKKDGEMIFIIRKGGGDGR